MASDDFGFKTFSTNRFYTEQNAHLVDMVEVDSGQRIIDLACGTGGVTRLIANRLKGARDSVIIGIDHSASALKQAMEDLRDVRDAAIQFCHGKVEDLSEAFKGTADTVIFCNAIHYVPDKGALLREIAGTLKPGGKLAFNTSFYDGAHPPETLQFYRRWMMKAARTLRREYGLSPSRTDKVEARKHLSPEEYRILLEGHGFRISRQEVETVKVPIEGWLDISSFEDFITGTLPGVPLDKASASLKLALTQTFHEMGLRYVPRNWLDIVAIRV